MDILLFIYNVVLLILYALPLAFSCLCYRRTGKRVYQFVHILFMFYIFDNLVIYMTEFINRFSRFYDSMFMSVPTFKTVIFVTIFFCMLSINAEILKKKCPTFFLVGLGILTLFLLFIPMLPNTAWKVWWYYFPCQVFSFLMSLYGLDMIRKDTAFLTLPYGKLYRQLLIVTLIFSVLIVIEDSIVILNFDVYSNILVKINNRSVSEDILSIFQSITAIRLMAPMFQIQGSPAKEVSTSPIPETVLTSTAAPAPAQTPVAAPIPDSVPATATDNDALQFYLFCKEYQLTAREQDIMKLLLQGNTNEEISNRLIISLGTTKAHIHNIFSKVDVNKRRQLLEIYEQFRAIH